MVPVWLLILLLCLQALAQMVSSWIGAHYGNKDKARTESHVEGVLDRFLARKLEDINMSRLLSQQISGPMEEEIEADEVDASTGMTPEQIRATIAETEAEVELARQAGERA